MDKKKIISISILAIGIISIIVVAIIMLNKGKIPIVVSKPLNETTSLEEVFKKIKEIEEIKVDDEEVTTNEKAEDEIDFKEYSVLEKKAMVYTTDESVNEVWMIKLGSYDQQEDVCRILGNRVQKLKNAFNGNAQQKAVIKEAVIKQEDGIVIMIISPYVKIIEETIAKEM